MQNRNVIKIFAVLLAIVCLYQLSFTWIADGVEEDAQEYAHTYVEDNLDEIISDNAVELQRDSFPFTPLKSCFWTITRIDRHLFSMKSIRTFTGTQFFHHCSWENYRF